MDEGDQDQIPQELPANVRLAEQESVKGKLDEAENYEWSGD